jgi:hypothetical protein
MIVSESAVIDVGRWHIASEEVFSDKIAAEADIDSKAWSFRQKRQNQMPNF